MRNKTIQTIKVLNNNSFNTIDIQIYYLDSANKGLYLSINPYQITTDESGNKWKKYVAYSGIRMQVLEMKRFSQKTLDNFEIHKDQLQKVLDHVLRQNNIVHTDLIY